MKTPLYKKCLLTLVVSMSLLLLSISVVNADGLPQITIEPPHVDVADVGQSFSVVVWLNVTQANVTNLKGWIGKVGFNNTIVNCTSATLMAGHPLEGLSISSSASIENELGYVMYQCITMPIEDYANVTETKPLCRLNFTALDYGDSALEFLGVGLTGGTYMINNLGVKIPFEPVPSEVTVIPEFSAFMLLTLLMAATAVSALAAKRLIKSPTT